MKYSERLEAFGKVQAEQTGFLQAVLWKLTGDEEIFAEAMQYALMGIWRNIEKLKGQKATGYIYKIALSANSKAWRNRITSNGQLQNELQVDSQPDDMIGHAELVANIRKAISRLPAAQSTAIAMRYLQQQDYETIAGQLGCSAAGARSHVSKALATLKNKLAKQAE